MSRRNTKNSFSNGGDTKGNSPVETSPLPNDSTSSDHQTNGNASNIAIVDSPANPSVAVNHPADPSVEIGDATGAGYKPAPAATGVVASEPDNDQPAGEGDGFDDLATRHETQRPPADPLAVAAERARLAAEQTTENSPASDDGFEHNADGSIAYCADGVTPRRKRGRKKESAKPAVATKVEVTPIPGMDSIDVMLGGIATRLVENGAIIALGPEWEHTEIERVATTAANANYLRSLGLSNVHPLVLVAATYLEVAAKRASMPITKSKFSRFKTWIVSHYVAWRMG